MVVWVWVIIAAVVLGVGTAAAIDGPPVTPEGPRLARLVEDLNLGARSER